jgi:hypothetical protein
MLSPEWEVVGPKYSARIWALVSKFIMLDRFSKTLGAADIYPGVLMPKKTCSVDYLGTGSKVSIF